jgi:Mn2+/Fe2+ NRAMP family transporter
MTDDDTPISQITVPDAEGVYAEPWSVSKVGRMMRMFGPAAIVASCAIGAGETIVVVRAGSCYSAAWLRR